MIVFSLLVPLSRFSAEIFVIWLTGTGGARQALLLWDVSFGLWGQTFIASNPSASLADPPGRTVEGLECSGCSGWLGKPGWM